MSIPGPTPAEQQKQIVRNDQAGEVLQAATTVAGLAVALVVILPSTSITKLVVLQIGGLEVSLGIALLFSGLCALASSLWVIDQMRREIGMSFLSLLVPKSGLSFLFIALVLFLLVYLKVVTWF